MKFCVALLLVGLSAVPALAHPSKMDGRWSTKKGNCQEEYKVTIRPKTFDRYEESCKIVKETSLNPLNIGKEFDDYELKLSCLSEGEETKDTAYMYNMETNDQIKVSFGSDKPNTFRWLYRCKK